MKKITLNVKGGNVKQYSTLILELNLMAKTWSKFGVKISLPGHQKTINWGTRNNDGDIPTETTPD
mgnify:CR=1 FL=1